MQRLLLFLFLLLFCGSLATAQRTAVWDGPAAGDWDDPTNWNMDVAPVAGDTILFTTSAVVNGTSTGDPVQLRVGGAGTQVTLNLDLTIGGSATMLNTIVINAGSRLVFGPATFNINPEASSNGINIGSTADGASLNIQGDATVNITGGRQAINLANATGEIINRGTTTITNPGVNGIRHTDGVFENRGGLTISGAGQNGIETAASFTNFRTFTTVLTIENATFNAIKNTGTGIFTNDKDIVLTGGGVTLDGISSEGTFVNMVNSTIVVSGMDDDGVEVVAGTFDNNGTLTTTGKADANSSNNALAIAGGVFTNTSDNSLNADGGGTSGRAIAIDAAGTLINTGTVTITGGDELNRINNMGTLTNGIGGDLDLTDGRINNSGSIVNDGLIVSTRAAAGIFSTGTAVNNGFYTYGTPINFTVGTGTLEDFGISLDRSISWRIDAENGCSVDIANVSYEYTEAGSPVGTSAADGTFTFDETTFSTPDVNIKPVGLNFPTGLKVRLLNATCNRALPVVLAELRAIPQSKSVLIEWTTASEDGNDYMAVERSADGQAFTEIGRRDGSGNSVVSRDYFLEDQAPLSGTNYYRLRQVDRDGTIHFSGVVSAEFGGADAGAMKIYPSVVRAGGTISVELGSRTGGELTIVDGHGRQYSTQFTSGGDTRSFVLPSHLSPGMHYLIHTTNDRRTTTRFLIQ